MAFNYLFQNLKYKNMYFYVNLDKNIEDSLESIREGSIFFERTVWQKHSFEYIWKYICLAIFLSFSEKFSSLKSLLTIEL